MASSQIRRSAKVFIDSSVFMATAISASGSARQLLLLGTQGGVSLCVSPLVLQETGRNLARKAPEALAAFRLLQDSLGLERVEPSKAQVLRAARVVDIKDAPIVAGAVRARADYLATYDRRHLLARGQEISNAFGFKVVTPDEVLREGA